MPDNPVIYIFTPAGLCSGGPEALHQLAYYLHEIGIAAYNVYYNYNGFPPTLTPDRYKQYGVETIDYNEIKDIKGNLVIAPENAPWCLNGFKKAQKCIWWLSVAYNQIHTGTFKERIIHLKRRVLGQKVDNYRHVDYSLKKCWHLCGSKYAYEKVKREYPKSVVEYLVEPISLDFLRMGSKFSPKHRDDIVLYNPSKPSALMSELLQRGHFSFIPLKGFTPLELAEKYKSAKLYVDFGRFGGPERMPKEAVYFGCNILVVNHNAASNDFDVAIPVYYKINDKESILFIEDKIKDMLLNYEAQHTDFLPFHMKVQNLEGCFRIQLNHLLDLCRK